jgi:hypothetical protein
MGRDAKPVEKSVRGGHTAGSEDCHAVSWALRSAVLHTARQFGAGRGEAGFKSADAFFAGVGADLFFAALALQGVNPNFALTV